MLHCLNGKSKKDVRILFVNPCLRKNGNTKLLPVGLGYIMTYFRQNGYKFSLLDIDINEYSDSYMLVNLNGPSIGLYFKYNL